MNKSNRITLEFVLYGLIFLAALAIRLFQLGGDPLLDIEASWAFQAWQLAEKELIPVGSQVGYLAVTEAVFSLFGANNFLARFWPVLVGSAIVWLPFFIRKELNRIPALVIAAGLALDPTLVPASRFAGGLMPALTFLALALGTFHAKNISWSLIFLGLGLLSGPDFWIGILILGIVVLISRALGLIQPDSYFSSRLEIFKGKPGDWIGECTPAILIMVLVGSFFIRDFRGLSAWVGALPELFQHWGSPLDLGFGKFLVYLFLNNPLVLVFGLPGFYAAWRNKNRLVQILSIWFAAALLIFLLYPGRQAVDLAWLTIPLWAAAAVEFTRITTKATGSWVTQVMAGIVVVLTILNWLTFTGMIFQSANENALLLELGLALASLALIILSAAIISSEWGWLTARKGMVGGVGVVLLLYLVGSLTLDVYLVGHDPRSIFSGGKGTGQMELLGDSIADVSISATGRPESIRGALISDSQALRWAVRDFREIDHLVNPPVGIEYPILITTSDVDSSVILDNYRGQDFVLYNYPGWGRIVPDDWISWIAFREAPLGSDYLILWVRNDIYSGY